MSPVPMTVRVRVFMIKLGKNIFKQDDIYGTSHKVASG